jgi:putative RecB family exonuclease
MSDYRSWSQLSDYERCPLAYKLKRVDKVWKRPAAWLDMGTAVHEACERWELSDQRMSLADAVQVAKDRYIKGVNRLLDETPNASMWFRSGPYDGAADIERRYGLLESHVGNYIRYYTQTKPSRKAVMLDEVDDESQTIARVPAVEVPFTMDLGGVEVRGKIDKVEMDFNTGTTRVVDLKTGANPGGPDQLKVYSMAMRAHDYDITVGSFFMTKRGTPTRDQDLTQIPDSDIVERFQAADTGIREEKFPAKVGDHCSRCEVNTSCPFWK